MKKLIFFIILLFCFENSYATNSSSFFASSLTIKELSKNIESLKQSQKNLKIKNKEISKEYWELVSFIRNDINSIEILEIQEKINNYIENRDLLEKDLLVKINSLKDVSKEKKDLILLKAWFYKYLAKFVKKEKKDDFIAHIKFQIQSEKESKDLIEEILKNQFILDQKVTYIKEKIETHREDLQARIEVSITQKIKQRIDEIDTNEKYKDIDKNTKNNIYNDFIQVIKQRLIDLENSNLSENYKEMRKNILSKMIEEIQLKIK